MAETEDKQTNNQNAGINIGIYKIFDLFKTKLKIPDYQRPYEWTEDQIKKLLNDIDAAIEKNKEIPYHIGTIILHKDNDVYDIVDGQQRCISLSLLFYYLLKEMKKPNEIPFINNISFENEESIKRIQENYKIISTYYNGNDIKKIFDFVKNKMQAAVLVVNKIDEAFQLFDSQNTRGKDLYPHDLLKAYHLRSMVDKSSEFDIKRAVISWENNKDKEKIDNINELFEYYLYPILKWSRREDYKGFTKYNIDEYKNLTANDCYTYLKRIQKSMPIFQITEPTDNGKSFFEMVEHYRSLAFFIISECKNFLKNNDLPVCGNKSYDKAKWLFYCATLMYYDRFACELEAAIKKTFTWAFALYVKKSPLKPESPNKYIRETSNIFYDIKKAKSHTEITRKHFDPGIISEFVNVYNTYKNGNKTKKPSNYDSRKCFYNKIAELNNLENAKLNKVIDYIRLSSSLRA